MTSYRTRHGDSSTSTSNPSPDTQHYRRTLRYEIQEIFDGSIRNRFPQLLGNEVFSCTRLDGTSKQEWGDYLSINVLTICQGLRGIDPHLFSQKRPLDIAHELIQEVMKNPNAVKMLDNLQTHDVGYITFNLRSDWMVKRIKTMLGQGIDTWAPVNLERAVVREPVWDIDAGLHADEIRSPYIRQMLSQMLRYAGVTVNHRDTFDRIEPDHAVKRCFFRHQRHIKSRRNGTSLFVLAKGETSKPKPLNNIYRDLETIWKAINIQRAQLIVYVTPVRQRKLVEQCFAAARTEKWLPAHWSPTLLCCGYRTSNTEREKLETVWNKFESHPDAAYLLRLGRDAGYSGDESFECTVKYTYLKTHRLAACKFSIDEMLDEQGDSFVYLLKTQAIVLSQLSVDRSGMVNYAKVFFEGERELEVHLVQFTEVIDEACLTFNLHLVCQYLHNLCKKFTSYYNEVLKHLDIKTFKSKYFVCDAVRVVMKKCFQLMGIAPGTSTVLSSVLKQGAWHKLRFVDHFIPLPVSKERPKHLNSRFEMFGMNVIVYDPDFETGDLFGNVSLIDKEGLLFDQRLPIDKNDNGHVSYFYHEADEAVGICRNSDLLFGNPSPSCCVPFWLDVEINAVLFAITAEKDKSFQLLNCQRTFPLSEFWANELNFKCSTFRLSDKDGSIDVDYIMLRDAFDTSMTLVFESPDERTYLTGSIYAYYGNGVLDGIDESSKDRYKAVLFHLDTGFELRVGEQELKKSVMAVPADGCLVIEAVIFDVKTGKYVLNEPEKLYPRRNKSSKWHMAWENGSFNLTVEWTKGPKCLYA